jgi:hypothetical protein
MLVVVRLALVVLVSALGLAAAQPALANGGPDPKLAGLIASCKARSSGDALKECVTSQLKTTEKGLDTGRAAQSLCKGELGLRLGAACVSKLSALLASCKARTSGDAWKECVKSQLTAAGRERSQLPAPPEKNGTAGFDPARAAQSLCQGPLGVKLGEGCVTKLTDVLAGCKGQASGTGDTFKACVTAQLPAETRTK